MMLNIASPENCFSSSLLPHNGVGLARLEFIINNYIKIHPLALLEHKSLDPILKNEIDNILNVEDLIPEQFFIKHLSRGIAKIASAFYPEKVIVRLSDFKSNDIRFLGKITNLMKKIQCWVGGGHLDTILIITEKHLI